MTANIERKVRLLALKVSLSPGGLIGLINRRAALY
jgi:hypothetical protein